MTMYTGGYFFRGHSVGVRKILHGQPRMLTRHLFAICSLIYTLMVWNNEIGWRWRWWWWCWWWHFAISYRLHILIQPDPCVDSTHVPLCAWAHYCGFPAHFGRPPKPTTVCFRVNAAVRQKPLDYIFQ